MAIKRLSNNTWDKYKRIITDFINQDAGKMVFTYRKAIFVPDQFGEDTQETFLDIELEGLFNFNSFRTWPINVPTVSGDLDNQNCALIISVDQLEKNGLLDGNDYWTIDPARDQFIVSGKRYKSQGDTQVSQANDKPILFQVVLARDESLEK